MAKCRRREAEQKSGTGSCGAKRPSKLQECRKGSGQ
jgi:hypothetical protein